MPTDTPLSIIRKHIPQQSDIDKIIKSIESCVIHGLELPIQAQDLVKVYQTATQFQDIYHYITDGKLPSGVKAQACIQAEALNYVVINNFLFRIDTHEDKDQDKENSFRLVIPVKYKPIIFHSYCHGLKIRVFYFLYISQILQMNWASFMVAQVNAVLPIHWFYMGDQVRH